MSESIPIPTDRPVRVRIAPSPTGDPHVGTAYIGLFNMVFARLHGGQFILRIEDTDQARSTPQSEAAIMQSLRWAGLEWDEGPDVGGSHGPYRQSERAAIYQEHATKLLAEGRAYYCFATPEELAAMRKERKKQGLTGYDRRYRDLDPAEAERRKDAGETCVVRLKMPIEGQTTVVDALRGEIVFDNVQLDDQVLLKSDGLPTYHLANVVDDHLMGVTHVIRAEEWIPSLPKHVEIYRAFGWEPPVFIHLPLLRNPNKSKISKRKNPVSLEYYQRAGYLPEALLNYLGRMGWSMPDEAEKFTVAEMTAAFTFDRVSLAGPVFDLEKLDWLNGLYIRDLTPEALTDRLLDWALNRERVGEIVPLIQPRITRLEDFVPMTTYFFAGGLEATAEQLIPKKQNKRDTYKAVKRGAELIDQVFDWRAETLEAVLRGLCDELEWKPRDLFMTIRLIVTGRKASPGLFETVEAVGKARCQARFREAMRVLRP